MTFSDQLNALISDIGCTSKQLADRSHLGAGTISRYRNGERTPSKNSPQYVSLINGLALLSSEAGKTYTTETLTELFDRSLATMASSASIDFDTYIRKLNRLIDQLEIRRVDLARYLHADPSWISRVLSGQRQPSDLQKFTADIADYVSGHFHDSVSLPQLLSLLDTEEADVPQENTCQWVKECVIHWLGSDIDHDAADPVHSFLVHLNDFDLEEFMRQIHFQDLKVPTLPFQLPGSRDYYGIEEMKQAELDFLKTTVTARSLEDVYFYSDMPMMEMAADEAFKKKWMFGMAMMLRKGLHLHIVHDVHRPFQEMLLGLENWIPMYMTGQISPYYFKEPTNATFLHFLRSSGVASVSGEAIAGKMNNGRYTVSRNRIAVQYIRKRAQDMISCAKPLMHIYRQDKEDIFHDRLDKLHRIDDNYRLLGSAPPLFTMSESLLESIMARQQIGLPDRKRIRFYRETLLKQISERSSKSLWTIVLPALSEEELIAHPVRLPLSELFMSQDLCYTPEEYALHTEQTKQFTQEHPQFQLRFDPDFAFRNIRVTICENRYVLVSKSNAPAIHFVIYHPKMISAFQDFIL